MLLSFKKKLIGRFGVIYTRRDALRRKFIQSSMGSSDFHLLHSLNTPRPIFIV